MLRTDITRQIELAVDRLIASGKLPEAVREAPIEISDTKNPEHGDFACNFAMVATKRAGIPPRQIGEMLREALLVEGSPFAAIDVAGPGFVNLKLHTAFVSAYVQKVLALGTELRKQSGASTPQKINIEFVSVNPNGPITVGSGRGAAFGDTVARVLDAMGHQVDREYYINDGVNSEQMRLFAASVKHYVREKYGLPTTFPEKGYRGEYVKEVADEIPYATKDQIAEGAQLAEYHVETHSKRLQDLKDRKAQAYAWDDRIDEEIADAEMLQKSYEQDLKIFGESLAYIKNRESLADEFAKVYGPRAAELSVSQYQDIAQKMMIARQRGDLAIFGVEFQRWFSEQSLHDGGKVKGVLDKLESTGNAYRAAKAEVIESETAPNQPEPEDEDEVTDGGEALWLRSTAFGDDKDRVLVRADGRPAYIAADVAYLENKLGERSYDKAYLVLGPDHHGYIGRMYAACKALGFDQKERFEIIIFQIVRFLKDGKPAPMRKRDGNIYELRDLIKELGAAVAPNKSEEEQLQAGRDVSRFFYLARSHDTHMDFDIDLATKQSDENPVFYVQYAHARICSVLRKGSEAGFSAEGADLSLLTHPREMALVKKVLDLPFEVERCSRDFGVHRLTTYAIELARTYHHFYDACRVVQADQPELTKARMALCEAARVGLRTTLEELLGVSAPERMDREESV